MGYYVEIEKADAMELSKHIEKALMHAGKAMRIAEDMCEGGEMGMRTGYGMRGYGSRNMGLRDDDTDTVNQYDDYGMPIGMRRGRDSRGRFM